MLNLPLDLTLIEYSLLAYLVTAAPRVVTPQELISRVHGRSHSHGRLLIFQDITNYYQTNAELEATLEAFPDLIRPDLSSKPAGRFPSLPGQP